MSSSAAAAIAPSPEAPVDAIPPAAARPVRPPKQQKTPKGGAVVDDTQPFVVELIEGRDAFVSLEKEWNAALAKGPRDEPMLRHEWVRAHVENFTPSAPLRVFVARSGGELHAAIALVEKEERGLDTCWLPLKSWELPVNDHSQRGGVLLGRRGVEALDALWDAVAKAPGWDRLRLRDLPEGAPEFRLRELASKAGHPFGLWTSLHSPYVPLAPGKPAEKLAAVEAKADSKFKANLRRRRRRLAEQHGEVKYLQVDNKDAKALDLALADFFDIEASGWKGEGGSAIALDPKLVGFYTQIARDAAKRGALQLSFVEAAGKRIAGHLAIAHGGRFFLIKVGYDESFREFSPGQQLAADAIKASCDQGLSEFDFLGPCMDWKLDWAPRLRTHTWLTIFGKTPKGRLVQGARHVGWPVARSLLDRGRELLNERSFMPAPLAKIVGKLKAFGKQKGE